MVKKALVLALFIGWSATFGVPFGHGGYVQVNTGNYGRYYPQMYPIIPMAYPPAYVNVGMGGVVGNPMPAPLFRVPVMYYGY